MPLPVNKAKRERNGEKSNCSWQRNLSEGTAASQGGCPGEKGGLCSSIFLLLIPAGRAIPLFQGNSVHTGDTTRREPRMPLLPAVPGQCPQRWLWAPAHTRRSQGTLRPRTQPCGKGLSKRPIFPESCTSTSFPLQLPQNSSCCCISCSSHLLVLLF